MNAKQHPVAKTSIDLRRSISRLETFVEQFPGEETVVNGTVATLIEKLKDARAVIPKDLRDPDVVAP